MAAALHTTCALCVGLSAVPFTTAWRKHARTHALLHTHALLQAPRRAGHGIKGLSVFARETLHPSRLLQQQQTLSESQPLSRTTRIRRDGSLDQAPRRLRQLVAAIPVMIDAPQMQHAAIRRIVQFLKLIDGPVKPLHDKEAGGDAVRDKNGRRAPRGCHIELLHVPQKRARKGRDAVKDVGAALAAIGESVKEATKLGPLAFGALNFGRDLEIAKILLAEAGFFARVQDGVVLEYDVQLLQCLFGAQIGRDIVQHRCCFIVIVVVVVFLYQRPNATPRGPRLPSAAVRERDLPIGRRAVERLVLVAQRLAVAQQNNVAGQRGGSRTAASLVVILWLWLVVSSAINSIVTVIVIIRTTCSSSRLLLRNKPLARRRCGIIGRHAPG